MKRAVILVVLAGCDASFAGLTAPPPGRQAALDTDAQHVVVSRGVAFAFSCVDADATPCHATIASDDPTIAAAFPASLDTLSDDWTKSGPQPKSAFVVVGKQAGSTTLRFHGTNDDADADISVEVVNP